MEDFDGGGLVGWGLEQIGALGRKLSSFLSLFADCFGRREARELLRVDVSKIKSCIPDTWPPAHTQFQIHDLQQNAASK